MKLWGGVAATAAALALLSANLAQLLPPDLLAGLHGPRAAAVVEVPEAAAIETPLPTIQPELARLAAANQQLQAEAARLAHQFDGLAATASELGARVDGLEEALPRLVKSLPLGPAIDSTLVTGSIGAGAPAAFDPPAVPARNVSVRIVRSPLPAPAATEADDEPMPAPLAAESDEPVVTMAAIGPWSEQQPAATPEDGGDALAPGFIADEKPAPIPLAPRATSPGARVAAVPSAKAAARQTAQPIGIAIGAAVPPAGALKAWEKLASRVGIMLVGLSPRLADDPAGSPGKVLVAGPIASLAVATTLCADISRAGISCMPVPYGGAELTAAQR